MTNVDQVLVGGRRTGKATAQILALEEELATMRARVETTLTLVEQANQTSAELLRERDALRAQMAAESARLEWCIGVLIALPGYLVTDTGCGCCGDQMRFDEKLDGRAAIDAAILARGAR